MSLTTNSCSLCNIDPQLTLSPTLLKMSNIRHFVTITAEQIFGKIGDELHNAKLTWSTSLDFNEQCIDEESGGYRRVCRSSVEFYKAIRKEARHPMYENMCWVLHNKKNSPFSLTCAGAIWKETELSILSKYVSLNLSSFGCLLPKSNSKSGFVSQQTIFPVKTDGGFAVSQRLQFVNTLCSYPSFPSNIYSCI